MAKYIVHVYAVMRFEMPAVEADSPEDAIAKVRDWALEEGYFNSSAYRGDFAESISNYVVDIEGDLEHRQTREFNDAYHVEFMKRDVPSID